MTDLHRAAEVKAVVEDTAISIWVYKLNADSTWCEKFHLIPYPISNSDYVNITHGLYWNREWRRWKVVRLDKARKRVYGK